MAALRYKDEHNKMGYLIKPTGSNDYHQIIDFLSGSHIRYALTTNPIISDSLVKQFWSTATLRALELGTPAILATIDKTPYTITKDLVRSRLQLADDGGIIDLPIVEIYYGMDHLGYVTEGKLTFFKNKFSPQWRFLVHTLLHCLSTKSESWDQFGSPISIALIFLSDGRRFKWSNYIFRGMVSNIGNAKKFLMYARFLQTILDIATRVTRHYKVLVFSRKLFANIRLNFAGHPMLLLPSMLLQAQVGDGAEHGQSSDPHTASFSQAHETDAGPFTTVEDTPMGGDFHTSPLRSSHAPHAGQPSRESELQAYKKLFKDVVGKLVKKVKTLEVKLKTKKRNPSVPTAGPPSTSSVPPTTSAVSLAPFAVLPGPSDVPTGVSTVTAGSPTVPTDVPSRADPTDVLSKGKSLMVEKDIPVKARTFKQMEEDRLGEETAKRLHDEEMAQMEKERAEVQRKRQQESSAIYNTGWTMAYVKSITDDQLQKKFENICKVQSHSQIQAFSQTLKRPGPVLEEPSSKNPNSPKAPTSSMPEIPISPAVSSPSSSHAPAQTFLKVVVNEDSDDEVWSVVGWEVLPTPLGEINALYRIDVSTKHFVTFRQILHMVDRQDLMKLYGLVVQYYENHPIANAGLLFWGDLQVLFDSQAGERVLSMFMDVFYPLSVKLMERMLMHKLEIDSDIVGNDLTTAEQLIQFIKNQLVAAQASSV
uniref:Synaptobrevin, longin-like domain protein n=1 Tax=Tanacetum cinerariifolium TaxID=118510 RepID=A0A6L2NL22_TANCI|nr:synaptobrevin, longin-like domain protein [Tanacetum cinerariifolium]